MTIERNEEQIATYDALTRGYNVERPLLGALLFLAKHGFLTRDDLEAALVTVEQDQVTKGRVTNADIPTECRRSSKGYL